MKKNQAFWDGTSDAYQATHGPRLEQTALAWGVWRIPESELHVLGDVAGREVLELGCGADQWTSSPVASGARAVELDVSLRQLMHARLASPALPLIQANTESTPLARRIVRRRVLRPRRNDVRASGAHDRRGFARPQTARARHRRVGGLLLIRSGKTRSGSCAT